MNVVTKLSMSGRKEILCLDRYDRPCDRKDAFRIIVKEFDSRGKLLKCLMSIDPSKDFK